MKKSDFSKNIKLILKKMKKIRYKTILLKNAIVTNMKYDVLYILIKYYFIIFTNKVKFKKMTFYNIFNDNKLQISK